MRGNRLHLVVPENAAELITDDPSELSAVAARTDGVPGRLRLMDGGEGAPPDDAA
jgi:hypothetical protein